MGKAAGWAGGREFVWPHIINIRQFDGFGLAGRADAGFPKAGESLILRTLGG